MAEAKSGIGNWIEYYNHTRQHQTLGTTPELIYAGSTSLRKAA
jgi:transposase InsO family protein